MTEQDKAAYAAQTVKEFALAFYQERARQLGQMIPGADGKIMLTPEQWEDPLRYMMEPQEWLTMARFGLGLSAGDDEAYMYEICQGLAEWMFSMPGWHTYHIPDMWYETPMGALWATAFVKVQGDELITLAQAAELAGVSVQAISQRVKRGTLTAYVDPAAPQRQGRNLVRRSDVEREQK